jgi:hypothetical protein
LSAINSVTLTRGNITQSLGQYWVIPGATEAVVDPGSLVGWKPFALEGSPLAATRLLPAVHLAAASVEALPSPLPRASATYVGRVFTTATARADFPGGGLLAGDHAACDGRAWYRVARIGSETSWYPQAETLELFRFAITTFVGIMPGALVFTSVGAGVGEVFARGETPDLSIIFAPHVLGPILGLTALSALPIILKKLKKGA